ncbi:MAG: sterol desaturase family protein [Pseudomonadota bacterium]
MERLLSNIPLEHLERWENSIGTIFFVVALGLLVLEGVRYAFRRELTWRLVGDSLTNYLTFGFFIVLNYGLLGLLYLGTYFAAAPFALFDIPTTWVSLLACLVLADFAYYWEHRFTHRVNAAWATHSVHHSSPYFNLSVANRFGPMDGIWPIFFHLPLVLLGFDPLLVLFCEIVVLQYQTFLHTEAIGKLPRLIEAVFNTPSHHRVHHGANPEYIDRNYAGILIVWDRLFGTFAEERATVRYGLTAPIDTVNPFRVFFGGLARLGSAVLGAKSLRGVTHALVAPPEAVVVDERG